MNFASYTTSEYFPIFLTFYDSIKHNENLNLHVLCLDKKVKKLINEHKVNCETIELDEVEIFSHKIKEKNTITYLKKLVFTDLLMLIIC